MIHAVGAPLSGSMIHRHDVNSRERCLLLFLSNAPRVRMRPPPLLSPETAEACMWSMLCRIFQALWLGFFQPTSSHQDDGSRKV